jgi:hypothetical protein
MRPSHSEILALLMSGVIAGAAMWFWVAGFNGAALSFFFTAEYPRGL